VREGIPQRNKEAIAQEEPQRESPPAGKK